MRIVGQTEIAGIFGVSARTITEWQASGMPVAVFGGPGVPGEYDAPACIRWFVDREVKKVSGGESSKDRLQRLQGDALEAKLALDRGKLIPTDQVEPAMRAAIVTARERLRNEPARIAALLDGKDHTERETLLRDLFDEVLLKLSQWRHASNDLEDEPNEHERPA